MNIKNSIIMVTGGTGSFGTHFINQLKDSGAKKIIVYSRDELKQHEMSVELKGFNVDIEFIVGDVRDRDKLTSSMKGVEYVIHAAALKQVPTGENFPEEIIKTNILGTKNVIDAAEYNNVSKLVSISTDKAAYPISCYGAAKLISERIIMAQKGNTINVCLRYGNVLGSRGSVIPLWLEQINNKRPITITEATMTRFILNLSQAVTLAVKALSDGGNGDLFVMKPDACSIETLAESLELHFGRKLDKAIIGIRNGEKSHETLLTANEVLRGIEEKDGDVVYVRIPVNTNKDYFSSGDKQHEPKDFTSLDAKQLNAEQVLNKLKEARLL
jgi:UDP-glucose 4-epimerase